MSFETLENWLFVGSLLALVVGAVTGIGSAFMSRISARRQEERMVTAETNLAGAQKDAADAQLKASDAAAGASAAAERAAKADETAASANARAAVLEKQAEEQRERAAKAERELLEVKERIAPRQLTEVQHRSIVDSLSGFRPGGELTVICVGGSPEPCAFAHQLAKALEDAGWRPDFSEGNRGILLAGNPWPAITLLVREHGSPEWVPAWVVKLQLAFAGAGLDVPIKVHPDVPEDTARLFVGSKQ